VNEPRPIFSQAARRGIPSLLAYIVEDLDHSVTELPDRKGRGGHPMYRRLKRSKQHDLRRLVRWLQSKQLAGGEAVRS